MEETAEPQTGMLHVRDFPSQLHDEVADRLALSSVGLSTIQSIDGKEHSRPAGSGTLVRLCGRRAILTADHVAQLLEAADRVNVLVDWQGAPRRCSYERQQLTIARLARGADDGHGPDLAVVFLPEALAATSTLVVNKVFHDLDRRIGSLPGHYHGVEWGFWFPCGVPADGGQDLGPMRGFDTVHGQWGLCAVAARPHEFEHEGFDYLDIRVPDNGPDVPTDLGGMSGAGLWQVLFRQGPDGTIRIEEYVLSGVAFYEWFPPNRRLRCHGRRSLHERLPQLASEYLGDKR
jgi:hypothetical protein